MAVGPLEPRLSRRKAAEGVVDPLGAVDPLRPGDKRKHHPGRARAQRHRIYGVLAADFLAEEEFGSGHAAPRRHNARRPDGTMARWPDVARPNQKASGKISACLSAEF